MLNKEQINNLLSELNVYLFREVAFRNEAGTLPEFLRNIGYNSGKMFGQKDKKHQKILIIGETEIKENVIIGIFKKTGISSKRIELISDYAKVAKHDFSKYIYNEKYASIIIGPTPHSGVYKGKYSSIIVRLEKMEGFPPVVRLNANKRLKVTNSNLTLCLEELIERGIVLQDL